MTMIVDRMFWWLRKDRDFHIDEKWKISLLEVDAENGSAKILITNKETMYRREVNVKPEQALPNLQA